LDSEVLEGKFPAIYAVIVEDGATAEEIRPWTFSNLYPTYTQKEESAT
jgi:hypothetical protein